MPAKLKLTGPNDETVRFNMETTLSWLSKVDDWRIKQPGIPNRSAAIRQIVNEYLALTKSPRKKEQHK
jgi:metal-responsive CopG/Arc/MetJ family transcriptional regulator